MPAFFFSNNINMKVIKLNQLEQFKCVPRQYPNSTDELSVKLKNELTNTVIDLVFTFSVSTSYLTIAITDVPADFESGNRYEITITNITNNNNLVYLGKLLIVDENTDVQNYEYKQQSNSRYEF